MHRTHIMLLLGLLFTSLPGVGRAQEMSRFDVMTRLLSPELRRIEERLDAIGHEMHTLPALNNAPWGNRFGYKSADLPSETQADWYQLDLGQQESVDMVVLMPVDISILSNSEVAGYGFPKRFKVEISDYPDMQDAKILVDRSGADVPSPRGYPLIFEFPRTAGRYVRVTSLKHYQQDGVFFWAMAEMMVMKGSINVAALKYSGAKYSSLKNFYPVWGYERMIDGQTAMGMPVDVQSPSPTKGYLSGKVLFTDDSDPLPERDQKWCTIDLGKEEVIEQVRLLPWQGNEKDVAKRREFPRKVILQLSNDPDFEEVVREIDMGGPFHFGYPDNFAYNIPVPYVKARYVRILVTRMWCRNEWHQFGLAEIQVYGSNRNLALGKTVMVRDKADMPAESGWDPSYLVDGYTGRYRLIEWPEYLRLIERRGKLEAEKTALDSRRSSKLKHGRTLLSGAGIVLVMLIIIGWISGLVRHHTLRIRETENLRKQIARDLHDDIGSNLGGIVLLSEIGSQHSTDEESKSDFESIRQAADDASAAMRDIVWLIQPERVGLKDFVTHLRHSARMILKNYDLSFVVKPAEYRDHSLGLLFRRHVFMAYKEVLNNVRKHAQTDKVAVVVEIEDGRLSFSVRDQGVGYDPEAIAGPGFGVSNLKGRASRVSGSVQINSSPGNGTEVIFEAPLSK